MLDLTPGQGDLCRAAVEKRIPYLGITMTSLHGDRLREQLTQWLQKQSPALDVIMLLSLLWFHLFVPYLRQQYCRIVSFFPVLSFGS